MTGGADVLPTAYFFGEIDAGGEEPANDNKPPLSGFWYYEALQRLAMNKTAFDHAHTAALMREPLG